MPIHRFQTADGKIHRVDAPTREAAEAELGRVLGKRTASQEVGGALETLYGALPFVNDTRDNVGAYVRTMADFARGKTSFKPGTGPAKAFEALGHDFMENRRQGQGRRRSAVEDFKARRPNVSALTSGVGLAAQVVPALFSGGATAVPALAANAPRGLIGATARAAKPRADSAVTAGLSAQVMGYGGDGTLAERQKTANETTLPAMALGAALPAGIAAASKDRRAVTDVARGTGRTAARLINKASGGKVLDPRQEAAKRLGEALKADGLGPAEVRFALTEWQRTGASSPAFMDLAGENTRALLRAAAGKSGSARNTAVRYADRTVADLQDNAIGRTRTLTPDERTIPDVEGDIARRITAASALNEVPAGSGGAAVHRGLNARFDAGKAGVDEAYSAARAADPQAAHLETEGFPQLRANIREAVRDFHPDDMPSVARELEGLDKLSTPTIRDLFEARQRLTAVRMSKPDQAVAAARAVRALDGEISDAVERGAVTGDPGVVDLWRQAIGARREFGRQFEGDDVIQRLTERELHGEGRTTAVAPEDAANVVLGRNGVSPRPDLTRDLVRLRDTLGPDSPEWQAFQRESSQRILGRDAGTEEYGAAWDAFARQSPELADVLSTAEQRAALATSRQQIGEAVADRGALETGRTVLRASPDRLGAAIGEAGERQPLAQLGAAREIEDVIGRQPAGATGVLNRLATGTNPGRNLGALFGDDEAARYQAAIRNEIDRVANARFISPNTGSQTALRIMDEGMVDLPPTTKLGIAKALFDKLRRGVTLTDGEREALLQLGTTIVRTADDIPRIPTTPQAMRMLTGPQRAALSRALSQFEGSREALANRGATE